MQIGRAIKKSATIAANIAWVRERVDAAAHRAGRQPDEIALMCVSKGQPPAAILEAYEAGARLFGENKVQEMSAKSDSLQQAQAAEWRLIGHLQSNKASKAAQLFHGVDSLDSLRTAEKLDAAAKQAGQRLPVLIEINTGKEHAKTGLSADSEELELLLLAIPTLQNLTFRGLMTIPPYTPDPEDSRPFFRALRDLRDQIARRKIPASTWDVLSMGMSHDFAVAVEAGSTCVRVGAAIFGERLK